MDFLFKAEKSTPRNKKGPRDSIRKGGSGMAAGMFLAYRVPQEIVKMRLSEDLMTGGAPERDMTYGTV
ncbi:hypothetical protein CABS01_17252 [Colletotrichum abscissum]|uniref:uncharacterized protein n=1 Tax=Colletotrichum abscissum TaxID=1671311 RepID=UPI0027D724DC|nr:uncharacterized protein CABS01_17252 [Colletotrichum abscissum]KAK1481016.1 hypothetical protein CABS01_17252 [Colletotrichum abscissum]